MKMYNLHLKIFFLTFLLDTCGAGQLTQGETQEDTAEKHPSKLMDSTGVTGFLRNTFETMLEEKNFSLV